MSFARINKSAGLIRFWRTVRSLQLRPRSHEMIGPAEADIAAAKPHALHLDVSMLAAIQMNAEFRGSGRKHRCRLAVDFFLLDPPAVRTAPPFESRKVSLACRADGYAEQISIVARFIETEEVNVVAFEECGDSYHYIPGVDWGMDSSNDPMERVLGRVGDEKGCPPDSAKTQGLG